MLVPVIEKLKETTISKVRQVQVSVTYICPKGTICWALFVTIPDRHKPVLRINFLLALLQTEFLKHHQRKSLVRERNVTIHTQRLLQ